MAGSPHRHQGLGGEWRDIGIVGHFRGLGDRTGERLIKNRIRVVGRFYQVVRYREARPDAPCGICSGWGHADAQCAHPRNPRCALCAQRHRTAEHKCPVQDCTQAAAWPESTQWPVLKLPRPPSGELGSIPKKEALESAKRWRGRASNAQPDRRTLEDRTAPGEGPLEVPDNLPTPRVGEQVQRHCTCHLVQLDPGMLGAPHLRQAGSGGRPHHHYVPPSSSPHTHDRMEEDKRPHASAGHTRPSAGQARKAAPSQTTRTQGPRGDHDMRRRGSALNWLAGSGQQPSFGHATEWRSGSGEGGSLATSTGV